MTRTPPRWTEQELAADAARSVQLFRAQRLEDSSSYSEEYRSAHAKFSLLLETLNDLQPGGISPVSLADAYTAGLGEAVRYVAGPPISEDDLRVIADVTSLAAGPLSRDAQALARVQSIIVKVIDPFRFPWVLAGTAPSAGQKEAALMASSALLAAQRIETARRNDGKSEQESKVKRYLLSLGMAEAAPEAIHTIVKGPPPGHFCAECQLGERKADVVVRLHDTRLMAIECKVSNSATNSIKRLNNDAAVKAEYWLKKFGTSQIVPVAMLAGVFKTKNLEQSQERGLNLFWSHDLDKLGSFIETTR